MIEYPAKEEDIQYLDKIVKEDKDRPFSGIILDFPSSKGLYVCIKNNENQPIGAACFLFSEYSGLELNKLYIVPSSRGSGAGRELVLQALKKMKKEGFPWVWIEFTAASINFWDKIIPEIHTTIGKIQYFEGTRKFIIYLEGDM